MDNFDELFEDIAVAFGMKKSWK